jgi:Leucine-rich repeat (LRR) protein
VPIHFFVSHRNLRRLHMRDNQVECLPSLSPSMLSSLEFIDLGKNRLAFIPTSFVMSLCAPVREIRRKASQLKTLLLDDNRIERLPAEICELDSLSVLYIQDNRISSLPASLFSIQSFKEPGSQLGLEWLLYVDPPLKSPYPPPNAPSDTAQVFMELAESMCA